MSDGRRPPRLAAALLALLLPPAIRDAVLGDLEERWRRIRRQGARRHQPLARRVQGGQPYYGADGAYPVW